MAELEAIITFSSSTITGEMYWDFYNTNNPSNYIPDTMYMPGCTLRSEATFDRMGGHFL
ncbi:MAG: hypothetical protein R6U17_03850 [Thermoplasmata archaeon]